MQTAEEDYCTPTYSQKNFEQGESAMVLVQFKTSVSNNYERSRGFALAVFYSF